MTRRLRRLEPPVPEVLHVTHYFPKSCYRFRIQRLLWAPGEVELGYCQELRPPDARCVPDRRDAVGLVIRIPAVVTTEVSSFGTSGTRPCGATDTDYSRLDTTPAGWRDRDNGTRTATSGDHEPRTTLGGDDA